MARPPAREQRERACAVPTKSDLGVARRMPDRRAEREADRCLHTPWKPEHLRYLNGAGAGEFSYRGGAGSSQGLAQSARGFAGRRPLACRVACFVWVLASLNWLTHILDQVPQPSRRYDMVRQGHALQGKIDAYVLAHGHMCESKGTRDRGRKAARRTDQEAHKQGGKDGSGGVGLGRTASAHRRDDKLVRLRWFGCRSLASLAACSSSMSAPSSHSCASKFSCEERNLWQIVLQCSTETRQSQQ